MYTTSVLIVLVFAVSTNAFVVNVGQKWRSSFAAMATLNDSVKKGDSDVIRGRLKKMGESKRQAAGILAPLKKSLSLELEEMADEIDETTEEYGQYHLITFPYLVSVIHNDSYNNSLSFLHHIAFCFVSNISKICFISSDLCEEWYEIQQSGHA